MSVFARIESGCPLLLMALPSQSGFGESFAFVLPLRAPALPLRAPAGLAFIPGAPAPLRRASSMISWISSLESLGIGLCPDGDQRSDLVRRPRPGNCGL